MIASHIVQGMLEVNPSLVEICLDSNFIGATGKDALMAGAPNCFHILLAHVVEVGRICCYYCRAGMYNNASQSLQFVSLAGNIRSGVLYKREEGLVTRIIWKP